MLNLPCYSATIINVGYLGRAREIRPILLIIITVCSFSGFSVRFRSTHVRSKIEFDRLGFLTGNLHSRFTFDKRPSMPSNHYLFLHDVGCRQ